MGACATVGAAMVRSVPRATVYGGERVIAVVVGFFGGGSGWVSVAVPRSPYMLDYPGKVRYWLPANTRVAELTRPRALPAPFQSLELEL